MKYSEEYAKRDIADRDTLVTAAVARDGTTGDIADRDTLVTAAAARDGTSGDIADRDTLVTAAADGRAEKGFKSLNAREQVNTRRTVVRSRRVFAVLMTLLLFFQINVVLQANRRYWDVQSDGYGALQRVQRCESLSQAPDVLYLGSSRAVYGVNPHLIDTDVAQAFGRNIVGCNAAAFGSTFEEDYYTLKRFISDGFIPKLVVENLWEYNLNINAPEPADRLQLGYARIRTLADLTDATTIASDHASSQAEYAADTLDLIAARGIPLYGDRIGLYTAICHGSHIGPCGAQLPGVDPQELHDYQTSDAQGFIPYFGKSIQAATQAERDALIGHLRQLYQTSNYHFTIGGHQPDYWRQLIELARKHGIQVVSVVSPMSEWYFKYAFQPGDWTMIANYWHTLCLQTRALCYDMSHAPGFTDADFEDPHHLNATGAKMFSSWLAQNVVGPWASSAQTT